MSSRISRCASVVLVLGLAAGCSSYQPTKNVWKGTKGLWYTYVSPPATVDYDEKGDLSPQAMALSKSMMGIDVELSRLERVMMNADKPPTREWMTNFFSSFPWVNGLAGVKYDGTILGREPATGLKELDFIPVLYEDKKQHSRALRCDVQNTPLGPEVIVATPLYDSVDFLGVVAVHFDMRSLIQYSEASEDIVILSPYALLWPGKYDFAQTPLAGVDWAKTATKSSSGRCKNAAGSFYYMVRYLGNLPLVFAVPENGSFGTGNGSVEQGLAYFPKQREKLPPPPERKEKTEHKGIPVFEANSAENLDAMVQAAVNPEGAPAGAAKAGNEIQPGSNDSLLLKKQQRSARRQRIQERQLEGENIRVEHEPRSSKPVDEKPRKDEKPLELIPTESAPTLEGGRPNPFGSRTDKKESAPQAQPSEAAGTEKPSEKSDAQPDASPSEKPGEKAPAAADEQKKNSEPQVPMLPGGRPSPFGSR